MTLLGYEICNLTEVRLQLHGRVGVGVRIEREKHAGGTPAPLLASPSLYPRKLHCKRKSSVPLPSFHLLPSDLLGCLYICGADDPRSRRGSRVVRMAKEPLCTAVGGGVGLVGILRKGCLQRPSLPTERQLERKHSLGPSEFSRHFDKTWDWSLSAVTP